MSFVAPNAAESDGYPLSTLSVKVFSARNLIMVVGLPSAFKYVDLNWEDYVITSEKYFRPNEVDMLLGNSSKARKNLKWIPKTSFKELVEEMMAIALFFILGSMRRSA